MLVIISVPVNWITRNTTSSLCLFSTKKTTSLRVWIYAVLVCYLLTNLPTSFNWERLVTVEGGGDTPGIRRVHSGTGPGFISISPRGRCGGCVAAAADAVFLTRGWFRKGYLHPMQAGTRQNQYRVGPRVPTPLHVYDAAAALVLRVLAGPAICMR